MDIHPEILMLLRLGRAAHALSQVLDTVAPGASIPGGEYPGVIHANMRCPSVLVQEVYTFETLVETVGLAVVEAAFVALLTLAGLAVADEPPGVRYQLI